jgi:hypothetical protein
MTLSWKTFAVLLSNFGEMALVILFTFPALAADLDILSTLSLKSLVGAILFCFRLIFKPVIICEDECHPYAFKHFSVQSCHKYSR